jgi:hypothetical protein
MNKKLIAVLLALVLIPASLAAVPVVVTWEWMVDDPMVTTFRYQVDGEDPSGWIVVDSTVTSYTEKGLDGSVPHTLYLQQSYDGINFSASSMSVADPIEPVVPEIPATPETSVEELDVAGTTETATEEPVTATEEPVTAAEEPAMAAEEPAMAAEEPVTAAEKPAMAAEKPAMAAEGPEMAAEKPEMAAEEPEMDQAESRYSTTISLGAGAFYAPFQDIGTFGNKVPQVTLGIGLNNLVSFGNHVGLGAEIAVSYDPMLDGSWTGFLTDLLDSFGTTMDTLTPVWSASLMPKLDLSLGMIDIYLGGGGFLFYAPGGETLISNQYMYGAFAKLSMAYKMNSWFSLGASGSYYWVLGDTTDVQMVKGTLFMGFTF